MTRKAPQPTQMTLDERVRYGTDDSLELVSGFLGATPEFPGGCQTVARVGLRGTKLISLDLLDYLVGQAQEAERLRAELEQMTLYRDNAAKKIERLANESSRLEKELVKADNMIKVLSEQNHDMGELLEKQRAQLAQWQSVFGHLGSPDEAGNTLSAVRDELEGKLAEAHALLQRFLDAWDESRATDEDKALWHAIDDALSASAEPSAPGEFEELNPDEINQMAFEEGHPAEDGDGYSFTQEEFELFVERLLARAALERKP